MRIKIIFLLVVVFSTATFGQTQWTKYVSNPVVFKQNVNTETYAIGQPAVIMENDTFKMWYIGAGLPYITSRILYAWSLDGITWNKHGSGDAVMSPGTAGEWDLWMDTPEIIHDDSGYKLYYFGDTIGAAAGEKPSPAAGIGVATSTDGINWTKYPGNPILTHGNNSSWDRSWIESPAILYDTATGNYLMWYSGVDTTTWKIQIGLATSPDGFAWTKYSGNPVVSSGTGGSYDDMWVSVPGVIKRGNEYELWYCALSSVSGFDTLRIAYATSADGINWTKYTDNPLFSTFTSPYSASIDNGGPWSPDVVYDPTTNTYNMWYETDAGFCLATSSSTVSISAHGNAAPFGFLIYPNPGSPYTALRIMNDNSTCSELKIFDMFGKIIFTKTLNAKQETLNLNLPGGIYFYFVRNENEVIGTGKIIIQ